LVVHTLDVGLDLRCARDDSVDVASDDGPDVVHGEHVVGRSHGNDRRAVFPADGEGVIPAGELLGKERRGSRIQRKAVEVDVLEPDLAGERACFVDVCLGRGDASASGLLCGAHRDHPGSGREQRRIAPSSRAAVLPLRLVTVVLASLPRPSSAPRTVRSRSECSGGD
jgi:hypothetical protein